ncbi:MAG: hypothetical protein Q7T55_00350 [Solirubrobacteraceae bacterium]|nr:hypothetical protein [Solirubrobacteraceae bacterium]
MFNAKTLIASTTIAATVALTPAAASAATTEYAQTPSGNITCKAEYYGGSGWRLTCSIRSSKKTLRISTSGRAHTMSYRTIGRVGGVMGYDQDWSVGPFVCSSYETGLSCTHPEGVGVIFLSKDSTDFYN